VKSNRFAVPCCNINYTSADRPRYSSHKNQQVWLASKSALWGSSIAFLGTTAAFMMAGVSYKLSIYEKEDDVQEERKEEEEGEAELQRRRQGYMSSPTFF